MRRACLVGLLTTLFACHEPAALPPDSDDDSDEAEDKSSASKDDAGSGKRGKADAAARDGRASDDVDSDENGSKGGGAGDDEPDAPRADATGLPCDVKEVLETHCVSCHAAETPQFGAPMSLASAADFHEQAPKAKTAMHVAAIDRIERTGKGAMPPSGQPPMPDEAKKTLLAWLEAEAPASDARCEAPDDVGDDEDPSDNAEASDCEISIELRAHDGDGKKFPVPLEDDSYECFYFKVDSQIDAETLTTSLSPLLDDTRVLHHSLLFAANNEDEAPSGTHAPCNGVHPGAQLLTAWLPGTPALVMPDDVGMETPSGSSAQFILENHYNNTARHRGASDNSGIKVCATKKPKSQRAAIHWLGSELITLPPNSQGSAQGTCTPSDDEPVHILGVIPHMHQLGRNVTMTINRADGSKDVLHEGSFEFENQTYYPKDVVLQPGDTVTTKCDYMNDTTGVVTLGEKTTQEMCYMFTLAYPVGSMNTGGDYLNPFNGQPIIQGPNRCMR